MRCFHSAWHGPPNRRMCTVVYYKNPQGAVEEEATRTRRGAPQAELSTPKQYLLRHTFLLILSPFRSTELFD